MKIVYPWKARQALRDIYRYIAYTLLAPETLPERNALYKEEPWRGQVVRFLPVKDYLVFYTVNSAADTISVVRILYGGRDISRQMEETME